MIKTIFFDFDGVLTLDASGLYTTCMAIQKHVPDVSFERVREYYEAYCPELLLGKTTHVAIWQDFCLSLGKNLDIEVLYEAFPYTPIDEAMMELCRNLQGMYTLGIITDNSKERFDFFKQKMNLSALFDIILVSGETGARKDKDAMFIQALDLAQCNANECLFIDNNASNLIAPKKLGWETIFYDDKKRDIESLIQKIERLGLSVA